MMNLINISKKKKSNDYYNNKLKEKYFNKLHFLKLHQTPKNPPLNSVDNEFNNISLDDFND
jgi:hypothetical protein